MHSFVCVFRYASDIYVKETLKFLQSLPAFQYSTNVTRNLQKSGKKENYSISAVIYFNYSTYDCLSCHCFIFLWASGNIYCIKLCNFNELSGVEILWKGTVSAEFRNFSFVSTKFLPQEIMWNYGILRSDFNGLFGQLCILYLSLRT